MDLQDSLIVNIPRSRFLPVKKTCDLMLVMSNLYTLDKGTLIMSPDRVYQTTPVVELGDEHFKKVCLFLVLKFTQGDLKFGDWVDREQSKCKNKD